MKDWINVKAQLPEENKPVDIFTKHLGRLVDFEYVKELDIFVNFDSKEECHVSDVTHWMPSPADPEEE